MLLLAPKVTGPQAEGQARIVGEIGPILAPTLDSYDINNKLRIAHFLAQICHESNGFVTTEEYATGDAYEGRKDLGNTAPGDGRRYKGRGLFQLAGRANYRQFGKALNIDLEAEPERAAEPTLALRIACEYWKQRGLNAAADSDDAVTLTKRINGGLNGLSERRMLLAKAKKILSEMPGA